jgi:hypothetical protein
MPNLRCLDCGGEHIYGKSLHPTKCWTGTIGAPDATFWVEWRCLECLDQFGRDLWDEEGRGPFPDPPMCHHTTARTS